MEFSARRILYEDDDLLAVDKPTGQVSHATLDPQRDNVFDAVRRWLQARDGAVGHLTQHHRLDRGTSGVMLFVRHADIDARVGGGFARGEIDKTYLAAVAATGRGPFPPDPFEVRTFVAPGRDRAGRTRVVHAGGQVACTTFALRAATEHILLVEARPATGRTHQIRVHLAHRGFPILGDTLYGADDPNVKRLMLHAHVLELQHPRSGIGLRIEAPLPRAFRTRFPTLSPTGAKNQP